jgi:hypothetical protein
VVVTEWFAESREVKANSRSWRDRSKAATGVAFALVQERILCVLVFIGDITGSRTEPGTNRGPGCGIANSITGNGTNQRATRAAGNCSPLGVGSATGPSGNKSRDD